MPRGTRVEKLCHQSHEGQVTELDATTAFDRRRRQLAASLEALLEEEGADSASGNRRLDLNNCSMVEKLRLMIKRRYVTFAEQQKKVSCDICGLILSIPYQKI